MKTKIIVLGQAEAVKPDFKKIEFVKRLNMGLFFDNFTGSRPSDWENIELVCSGYRGTSFDLMFAYNDNRHSETASLYLGHYNNEIV